MAAFPHVSMGRPFQEKYADVKWETNLKHYEAWKNGMTGYPIVDAVSGPIVFPDDAHIRHRQCDNLKHMVMEIPFNFFYL